MKKSDFDSEPELPLEFGPSSNGEVAPPPRTRRDDITEQTYRRLVDEKSQRLGMSRRDYLESACGMAAALFVVNQVAGCSDRGQSTAGGAGFSRDAGFDVPRDVSGSEAALIGRDAGFDIPGDALDDPDRASAVVGGDEFIFDVQVHNTAPRPPWTASVCANRDPMICPTDFMREVFVASDNMVACLSGFPNDTPAIETRARFKELLDMLGGSPRLLMHANVLTATAASLDTMARNAQMYPVAAWKTYPALGRLDSPALMPFLARARALDIKVIASHRGLGGQPTYMDDYSPRDMVAAAKMNPDITFLVYHSGYDATTREDHPFNMANPVGLDRLFAALEEFGVGKDGNVYAELGSTWDNLRRDPAQAAHGLGKLLKYLGPDRIVWGTDSVLTGRPQAQIEAFRAFQIPQAMQEVFGYPALTPEVKRKILGLNAARVYGVDPAALRLKLTGDDIARVKLAYRDDPRSVPMPRRRPHGPRTRREYLAFLRWSGERV